MKLLDIRRVAATLLPLILIPQSTYLIDVKLIARSELAVERAFEYKRSTADNDTGLTVDVFARRASDNASMSILIRKVPQDSMAPEFWVSTGPSTGYQDRKAAFSDYPVGAGTRRTAGSGGMTIDTYDGTFFVNVQILYRGSGARGNVEWLSSDREGDKTACEGIARRTLARLRALETTSSTSTRVGLENVLCLSGPRGETLANIDGFCRGRGWALRVNARQGICAFTAGSRDVIVPLAAKGIKVGSQWVETRDISVSKDGLWYVSLEALRAL